METVSVRRRGSWGVGGRPAGCDFSGERSVSALLGSQQAALCPTWSWAGVGTALGLITPCPLHPPAFFPVLFSDFSLSLNSLLPSFQSPGSQVFSKERYALQMCVQRPRTLAPPRWRCRWLRWLCSAPQEPGWGLSSWPPLSSSSADHPSPLCSGPREAIQYGPCPQHPSAPLLAGLGQWGAPAGGWRRGRGRAGSLSPPLLPVSPPGSLLPGLGAAASPIPAQGSCSVPGRRPPLPL